MGERARLNLCNVMMQDTHYDLRSGLGLQCSGNHPSDHYRGWPMIEKKWHWPENSDLRDPRPVRKCSASSPNPWPWWLWPSSWCPWPGPVSLSRQANHQRRWEPRTVPGGQLTGKSFFQLTRKLLGPFFIKPYKNKNHSMLFVVHRLDQTTTNKTFRRKQETPR